MGKVFSIALAPVFFGSGLRLFDEAGQRRISVDIREAIHSPLVTHLSYGVRNSERDRKAKRLASAI